jgi:hypothetical protein
MNATTNTNQPIHQIRLGSIKAALWLNSTQAGDFYNATFERLYKDGSEEWKSTNSFGRDDLLVLAKVADKANDWIFAQRDAKS